MAKTLSSPVIRKTRRTFSEVHTNFSQPFWLRTTFEARHEDTEPGRVQEVDVIEVDDQADAAALDLSVESRPQLRGGVDVHGSSDVDDDDTLGCLRNLQLHLNSSFAGPGSTEPCHMSRLP